jgi:hypothetical protein
MPEVFEFDVVIVGGTPGGIAAGIAAARAGQTAAVLERSDYLGGLPANGLGATDIATRGATTGLFLDFVGRVRQHYVDTYGADSQQAADCSDGYHFEPRIAALVFEQMIIEQEGLEVVRGRQFDVDPKFVYVVKNAVTRIVVTNRETNEKEHYVGKVFIDATYEGDLAAAAGVPFRLGRESRKDHDEEMAGRLYKAWGGEASGDSTGAGDNAVQAYNYRLCLTNVPENRIAIEKPASYNRDDYASIIGDLAENRLAGEGEVLEPDGIGRVVNMVPLPNGCYDANNQHLAFVSTDLPEENWPWPTSSWAWRDRFAQRLRDYTLGLLWFAQNDPELPEDFRARCSEWGLARSEYADNGHFPRQVYVREGRRVLGEVTFSADDALPTGKNERPPIQETSITSSHYALDSHAVRKREPGQPHLDGFFSFPTMPFTVPYGVMVPQKIDALLTPVPASATHVGFSVLRMEPCWMALGEAAGTAAAVSIQTGRSVRAVSVRQLQQTLLRNGVTLLYFPDAQPGDPHYEALQFLGLRGMCPDREWKARAQGPLPARLRSEWIELAGAGNEVPYMAGVTTRGEMLQALYEELTGGLDAPTPNPDGA